MHAHDWLIFFGEPYEKTLNLIFSQFSFYDIRKGILNEGRDFEKTWENEKKTLEKLERRERSLLLQVLK